MRPTQQSPKKALNKAFLKVKPNRSDIERFKTNLTQLIDRTNDTESEEFHKNLISDFLKKTYYEPQHFINTKGRNDLVIHNGDKASSSVGVILEAKKPTNKSEMLTTERLNTKAFQELLLYYLRERITHKNLSLKHLIATNIHEWFIFDAALFEQLFAQNKKLVEAFQAFDSGQLSDTKTDFFYKNIAAPQIAQVEAKIVFTYVHLQHYQEALRSQDKTADLQLIALFKLFAPEHLLKRPFANDSNSLDKYFYNELLHIIGLTETKQGSQKLIQRNKPNDRQKGSILENAILQLDSLDKISRLPKPEQYGDTHQERLFQAALELSITWINRILFLKLLEAQLIAYHKGDRDYAFLHPDKIKDYDDLNSLFFQVLARENDQRNDGVKETFQNVPYLNSSLFEPTELEQLTLFISNLKYDQSISIAPQTVLKDTQGRKKTGQINALQYLFAFLDAYDFGAEGAEEIQEENKTLINAAVLGLIFEKINGYKDGSFFTPGFITMYMCRETIRKAVIQKFKQNFSDQKITSLTDIYNLIPKKISRKAANQLINSLKICDPAVGSGHFLVSALNEIIAIKHDLGILEDKNGKSLHRYQIIIENDELTIIDEDGELFAYHPHHKESQRVQETLFHEKQTIIENCLFGVDINPNSIKICRLRLWIELLKHAYYKKQDPSGIPTLETLPNIDINIKCGNSLVSRFALDADIKQALKKSKWNIESYRTAVATYRNAQNKAQKREMIALIESIKADFGAEISRNDPKITRRNRLQGELALLTTQQTVFGMSEKEKKRWDKQVAQLTRDIQQIEDEIEAVKSGKIYDRAFEWRFEFPEVLNDEGDFVGFDVVIGNPPYLDYRAIEKTQIHHLRHYHTLDESPRPNLYHFFIELSYQLMREGAYFCYINPNSFLSIDAGYGIRRFVVENTVLQFIDDISHIKVFDSAATYTVIWSFKKEKNGNYPVRISRCTKVDQIGKASLVVRKNEIIANGKYLIIANAHQVIIGRIEQGRLRLGKLCQMVWGTSQSGYGKKKIMQADYDNLSDQEKQAYAPLLQTRDIKRHFIDWKGEYIPRDIFSDSVIEKFERPEKVVIARMTRRPQAAKDDQRYFVGKSSVLFDLDPQIQSDYLLGLLNSKLIYFWYANYFENTHLSGGYIRFDIPYLKKIPIALPSQDVQASISDLVQRIATRKKQNPSADTTALETQIDALVYQLYGLTAEEIALVEKEG